MIGDCDHPNFDENGVCTCCKEFYSRERDMHAGEIPCDAQNH